MITDELYRIGKETIVAQCSTYYPPYVPEGTQEPSQDSQADIQTTFRYTATLIGTVLQTVISLDLTKVCSYIQQVRRFTQCVTRLALSLGYCH